MDEALARIIIATAARAAREIGNLAPLLKQHADSETHEAMRRGIGGAVYEVYENILEPVFVRFPNLRKEFEDNLKHYETGA